MASNHECVNSGDNDKLKLMLMEVEVSTLKRQVQILTAELSLVHEGIVKAFGKQFLESKLYPNC
jgi:hypothetical protein